MHNILLIDDDERLADLLQEYFAKYQLGLTTVTHPSKGLQLLDSQSFDLIILDIMLPEMDGFEVCKTIRKKSDIPILMLTARGDVMDRVVGLELGADDYLSKPFEPRELVARIQNILKRGAYTPKQSSKRQFGDLTIDTSLRQVRIANKVLNLSTMEYQTMELFTQAPGKTFTRDEILNHLKGIDTEILSRSVDIMISRLRRNQQPLDLIKTIRGTGYIFVGQPGEKP